MKKTIVTCLMALLVVAGCCIVAACASSDGAVMTQRKHSNSKVIKSNYKVKGNNRHNSNTYNAR